MVYVFNQAINNIWNYLHKSIRNGGYAESQQVSWPFTRSSCWPCPTTECPNCQPRDVKAESLNGTIIHVLAMLPGGRLITSEPSQPGGQGQYFVFWEWLPFLQSTCSPSLFPLYIISSLFSILCRACVFCHAEVKQEGMCLTPFGGKGCLLIRDQAENHPLQLYPVYSVCHVVYILII